MPCTARARGGDWRRCKPAPRRWPIGVLLGAVQWLPSLDVVSRSTRADAAQRLRADVLAASVQSAAVLVAVFLRAGRLRAVDYSFHEFGIYSGAILMVCVAWVWIRRGASRTAPAGNARQRFSPRSPSSWRSAATAGSSGDADHLPVLKSIRGPVRYIVLVQFALADSCGNHDGRSAGDRPRRGRRTAAVRVGPLDPGRSWPSHDIAFEYRRPPVWPTYLRQAGRGLGRRRHRRRRDAPDDARGPACGVGDSCAHRSHSPGSRRLGDPLRLPGARADNRVAHRSGASGAPGTCRLVCVRATPRAVQLRSAGAARISTHVWVRRTVSGGDTSP